MVPGSSPGGPTTQSRASGRLLRFSEKSPMFQRHSRADCAIWCVCVYQRRPNGGTLGPFSPDDQFWAKLSKKFGRKFEFRVDHHAVMDIGPLSLTLREVPVFQTHWRVAWTIWRMCVPQRRPHPGTSGPFSPGDEFGTKLFRKFGRRFEFRSDHQTVSSIGILSLVLGTKALPLTHPVHG